MARILLVDDEQNVLNALRRELRDEYQIETFTSPLAALQRCQEIGFDLAISDYQMPEMNGVQFFGKLGEIHPDIARILLSGQADIEGLLGAINETHIYHFIAKPWETVELRASIAQALNYREILGADRRSANTSRNGTLTGAERPYRIMLVDHDVSELGLMSNALRSEEDGTYAIMRKELGQDRGMTAVSEWVIEAFDSSAKALEQARIHPYDLVIANHALPDMDGMHFLTAFQKYCPDAASILICAKPDLHTLSQAINKLHVDDFLNISWVNYELKTDVKRRSWNFHKLKTAVMQALVAGDIRRDKRLLTQTSQ